MIWITIVLFSFLSAVTGKIERTVGLVSFIGFGYLVGTPNYQYNGDALVYFYNYVFGTNNFELGYNKLANFMGSRYDYQTFRLYSSLMVYVLLFIIIISFTKHVSTVALFYAFAMFPFDNEQVRNGMAALFVLMGAWLLIKYGSKGVFPALAVIYLGSFFHSLALFFLLLPLFWIIREKVKRHFKILFITGSLFAILVELIGASGLIPIISELISRLSSRSSAATNVATVYSNGTSNWKLWVVFFFISMLMAVTGYSFKKYIDESTDGYYQMFLCTILLWIGGLLLLTISIDYLRILRVVSYFYFILIAVLLWKNSKFRSPLFAYGLCVSIVLMLAQGWIYGFSIEQIKSIIDLI